MNGLFGNLLNGLVEIWKNIGISQKVSIILVGLLTIIATGVVFYFGSQPDWQPLYSNLDGKTASKIYEMVKEGGVQVKLADGGRTILVPSADVYKLRLKCAGEGISVEKNQVQGLEMFDNMKLGLTDKQQQVAFQRAIQGELERMISQMPGIGGAKVILTLPQKSVFRKDKLRPTASVMLVIDQGKGVSHEQVNSIKYMVSTAVTGMSAQDVTITDNKGNLLARQIAEDEANGGDSNRQLELADKIEKQLKEKAEAILRPVVGLDKVVAMISCDIDFDNIDRVVEQYDNEKTAIISEKIVKEDQAKLGGSGGSGGKVGTSGNSEISVKNPTGAVAEEKLASEQKSTAERKFVVPKTVEKKSIKGGKVKRLTVAVTIGKKADGTEWSPEQIKDFKALVSAAVGIENYFTPEELRKNDPVKIQQMDFIKPEVQKFEVPVTDTIAMNAEKVMHSPLVRPVLGVILLAVLYIVFKSYFNKTGGVEGSEFSMGGSSSSTASVYGEDVRRIEGSGVGVGVGGNEKPNAELGTLLDMVQEKTSGSPQTVANIMEKWLAADQG